MTHIAIIDDQPLFRQGFIILLQQLHYTVSIEAANGNDFIDHLDHHPPPDLILLDTRLKGMDSFTLMQWIKNNHPDIPVIALHDKNDFHFLLQLLRAGATTHLLKTATPSIVRHTIQEVISNITRRAK